MPNRLAHERSPYLLQHANNPVDWFPWGEEAFAKARAEEKPIFLSIGYSTCHWCHVMAHESFESAEVAAVLNAGFVSIKVDREERPDVDRVYMAFVQATTGSGGWPMSVWLTPSLEPFYGGTYFPPTSRWGRPGFVEILEELARAWREDRERIESSASTILFIIAVGLLYYFVPNERARFRDVWVGAVFTGALWRGGFEIFSWMTNRNAQIQVVNGSIAVVVLFLMWVYVSSVILMYGVEFTAAHYRARRRLPTATASA